MKIGVIGGGSTYTPELVDGLLRRTGVLPVQELWLMDVDPGRLEVVGGFARRMVAGAGTPFAVHLTTDQAAAVEGAAFVVAQIRVGQMPARREDEYLGRRHGLIGQETTGVGGMANALRTIPAMLDLAGDIARLAPDAVLVNFTNPSGLVTEALLRHTSVRAIGLCNIPWNLRAKAAEWLGVDVAQVTLDVVGLNHLSWVRAVRLRDRDVTDQVLAAYIAALEAEPAPRFAPAIVQALGAWPNDYLHYYYHTTRALAEQTRSARSRAEEVMGIEEELLALYRDPSLTGKPLALEQRGGAYYSEAAVALMADLFGDAGAVHVVNVRNEGAIPNLPPDVVVEVACRVGSWGAVPLPTAPLSPAMAGLTQVVKAYERLTAEAAVHGDRDAARLALLTHPLGPDADAVEAVLEDMLTVNRRWLAARWDIE
ncbi:MAG: 6-phospho-beta-glucosidase [Anaerolineae bacterium]|jgi:6-phospho-beta-glucosidase